MSNVVVNILLRLSMKTGVFNLGSLYVLLTTKIALSLARSMF